MTNLSHDDGGAEAVPGDVADGERDAPVGQIERVVPVPADVGLLGARRVGRVKSVLSVRGQAFGQQSPLQRVGDVPLARVHAGAVDGEPRRQCELVGDEQALRRERPFGIEIDEPELAERSAARDHRHP